MTQTAVNYAKVLYELGVPEADISEAKAVYEAAGALQKILESPTVTAAQKHSVIDRLFPVSFRNFLKVLCDNHDVSALSDIFKAYHGYLMAGKHILEAEIYCVNAPDEAQQAGIEKFLKEKYGVSFVKLKVIKDTSLMGGFILQAGNETYDWSLKGRLEKLKQKLVRR